MADESFWIGDEFGPWLLHFSVDGELLAPPVELPDNVRSADHPLAIAHADIPRLPHSRGIEAMDLAGDNRTLVSILEGTVGGDTPRTLRVQRYDTSAGKWLPGTLIYELRRRLQFGHRHVAHRGQSFRGHRTRRPAR